MSDNLRRYRAIRQALTQSYPSEPRGQMDRPLHTLAALISGMVGRKSCQLPSMATKIPDGAKPESRVKRLSRWLKNEIKELTVFALMYNLIRFVMIQAARRQQVAIERILIDAMRWLASAQDDEPLPALVVNPHRPNRYEPRVRKRRPKPYPLMTKPRHQLRNLLVNQQMGLT